MIKIYGIIVILTIVVHPIMSLSQPVSMNSFLVAGHAYGAHAGKNIGLHPPFLQKLQQLNVSGYFALFLTGDIVNNSTEASWAKVENELEQIGIPAYYAMGNHDDNEIGHTVFNKKHGGTYYSFNHGNDCFIVLDSPKSDRSISSDQLVFMKDVLQRTASKRVFIFFHEVIWNSDVKYKGVMSNSRSRFDQINSRSNFWTDVFPILSGYNKNHFYLFAGDVGGNTDAISAFYDVRKNVTLLASGMGEVADENILQVDLCADTVKFTFLPLNNQLTMHEVAYYAVPKDPGKICGPDIIRQGLEPVEYWVDPVFNATSYEWKLPKGTTGKSDSSSILVSFNESYTMDTLFVCVVNSGYGKSQPSELVVIKDSSFLINKTLFSPTFDAEITQFNNEQFLQIFCNSQQSIRAEFYNLFGQHYRSGLFTVVSGGANCFPIINLQKKNGPSILRLSNGKEIKTIKFISVN